MKKRYALVSVADKEGIEVLAGALVSRRFEIISTGGTAEAIEAFGISVIPVEETVRGGEVGGGRVKTLSREIALGLMAPEGEEGDAELAELGCPRIDFVCMVPYDLASAVRDDSLSHDEVMASMDIGGPNALYEGIKGGRIVVSDPDQYKGVIEWLVGGELNAEAFKLRQRAVVLGGLAGYYNPLLAYLTRLVVEG